MKISIIYLKIKNSKLNRRKNKLSRKLILNKKNKIK
jgi:hypothetical protein